MTLTRAIYDYANELERVAEYPIAGRLRELAREFGDTDPPEGEAAFESDAEPFPLPDMRREPPPRIEEE